MKKIISMILIVSFVFGIAPVALAADGPAFAEGISAGDISLKNGSVTVSLTDMDGSAVVAAAFYDVNGQVVGVALATPESGAAETTLTAQLTGNASYVRVFLLDKNTLAPLCEEWEWRAVSPLSVMRSLPEIEVVDGIEPYGKYWFGSNAEVSADLSAAPALTYSLTISDVTTFAQLPAGYDRDELLEWGKYPGLNVDILHKHGFTGEGAIVAYVDQPIAAHEQYGGEKLHYTNNTDSDNSMHGPAVLSLLAGKDIGTAPDAEVYFYGHASWEADQSTHAECLYQIIEQNKTLPEGKKITMVGFSDNIDASETNAEVLEQAVAACEKAGIMVWFCGEYGGMSFLPLSNKDDYSNLVLENWGGGRPTLVYVPASGRTTAATLSGAEYIYWASGGLSWTMPYMLGLYGIAVEIDPSLTQEDLRTLIVSTAYNQNGLKIVNPVGFVAEVLERVGRNAQAQAMLAEAAARTKYLYAVMDTAAMSAEDLAAVGDYLASITDAAVLVADAATFSDAQSLYQVLKDDAAARNGEVVGVQIFGTAEMVPAFQVEYKVQMPAAVDEGGTFLTDLFYGNFDNDAQRISEGYNVLDHFAEDWRVDLVPDWPVARLPLEKGKYTAFFEKYEAFVAETGLERQDLVNFSNPIFASGYHVDDMGLFLNRMDSEFGLLNIPYRLYGNLLGQYPVKTPVLGGFTAENLAAENDAGVVEYLINSHGQWNNIDKCYYVNNEEVRESLLNMDTIDSVLDNNPYYLDCWTCSNGYGMGNNLTASALTGKCVGMFSATTTISNNGVNCRASVEEMANSNFYYFYFNYLKALHEGEDRGEAFSKAQKAYVRALLADSADGIGTGEGNYQFNLCNLLAYHNFGVLEPNPASAAFEASGYIAQAGQSVPKDEVQQGGQSGSQNSIPLTDGNPVGEAKSIQWSDKNRLQSGTFTVHNYIAQHLDNGYIRFVLDCTTRAEMPFSVFNPPNGDLFKIIGPNTSGKREKLMYDLRLEDVQAVDTVTMRFNFVQDDCYFLFFKTEVLLQELLGN